MGKSYKLQNIGISLGDNNLYLITQLLILVIIIYKIIKTRKEHMNIYMAPHRSRPSSSVDSENQFASTGQQWRGQSSKCYSCERQMQACGNDAVYSATKTKCFDCR
jgi:hypothetical protein